MDQSTFNKRITQIAVLLLIFIIAGMLIFELKIFLPGILGAITFYIISRSYYYNLIFKRKWRKSPTALLFIIGYVIIISIPIYLTVNLVTPKVNSIVNNQAYIVDNVTHAAEKIADLTNIKLLTEENIKTATQKVTAMVPMLLSSTATTLGNLFIMFFLLYFLLMSGAVVEKKLHQIIPLKPHNVDTLASETKMMIKANALGIPIICVVQGLFAALGYFIFGVNEWVLWGFLTGVFAFFPLVGTMIIWVPLMLYMFAQGITWPAIGLGIYSVIVTGNVDYIARISFMKKMGNVHPLITVLGVIVGLNLFGFIGLIFGPLLISYFIILVKIYINEFTGSAVTT
ncbi:AI-2E family transporter [Ferruginibacter yonginensis]|uniref:AI-2E family transporter n=1 Tax=Ferruginibacter yonginensis TaxID=1310416 RepID=A0ABV8QTU9_9BACT